ncbi:effector binding domain-containing protein [Paenibacillus sp. KS-LC4]|uniref:effector binding domain-containing protein n=1 Tax=Paenibacillus sp. KS-LC4 TaxID=2979727 RepID=UPI0030D2E81B
MQENVNIQNVMQVRVAKLESVKLIGFQGEHLDDQHKLFAQMDARAKEISQKKNGNQYLVILPGLIPIVAVEVNDTSDVLEGMTAYTIPEDEYVIFKFEEKYIGDFWSSICTEENQSKYNIDLSKPRYEVFTHSLQLAGVTEWYIPTIS